MRILDVALAAVVAAALVAVMARMGQSSMRAARIYMHADKGATKAIAAVGGRALADPEVHDDVVLSPHADPTHVELGRHDRPRDDTEVAVGSSREFPCVNHVEPDESTPNGVSPLQRDPHVIKVCGPTVMCHHETSWLARRCGSTSPLGCEMGRLRVDPHCQLGTGRWAYRATRTCPERLV